MNCETCHERLVEYLYAELDERRREAVEAALRACPDCRAELASLQSIRAGWTRACEVEPPARMHANILREARLAAAAREGTGENSPWWTVFFQPAFAMAAVAVIGVAVSIAVVGGRGATDDAPVTAEAVANGPVLDEAASDGDGGAEEESTLAALDEAEPGDDGSVQAPGVHTAAEAQIVEAVATAPSIQQTAVDHVAARSAESSNVASSTPSPGPRGGNDPSLLAEGGAGSAAGRGGGGVPIREPWQSRTLGGSALDNEGGTMTNAMRPDSTPEPDSVAGVEAERAEYEPRRARGPVDEGDSLSGTVGIGESVSSRSAANRQATSGVTTTGSTRGDAPGAAMLQDGLAAYEPPPSADQPVAQEPARMPEAEPAPAEAVLMADMDDASPSEEQMGSDGFADEIAQEARAEMGAAPDDLYARGTAAYDRGDWTAALDALASFVAASAPGDPRRAEAIYNVGASQVQLGQRDAARTTLERFVSLYPDHAWSESAQRLLDSLQRDANETMIRRQDAAPASEPASTTDE